MQGIRKTVGRRLIVAHSKYDPDRLALIKTKLLMLRLDDAEIIEIKMSRSALTSQTVLATGLGRSG